MSKTYIATYSQPDPFNGPSAPPLPPVTQEVVADNKDAAMAAAFDLFALRVRPGSVTVVEKDNAKSVPLENDGSVAPTPTTSTTPASAPTAATGG